MSVSKTPEGSFSPAKRILYDDGSETSSIDPALYAEETADGLKVYMLWGQRPSFNARGLIGAELIKDRDGLYTVVKKETERVLFTGEDDEFRFYEGASIRKINGIYYILFPSDKGNGVHTMSYAVSDYPLGPYEFGGNNHGSFCQINNQWYLFYHRGFDNGDFQRRVCVEKIYFDENGKIDDENGNLVKMTNHGFNGALDPYQNVGAVYATRVRVDGFKSSCYLTRNRQKIHLLTDIYYGNCIEFRDFDFKTGAEDIRFTAVLGAKENGSVDVILDDPSNTPICNLPVEKIRFSKYNEYSTSVSWPSGVHTVYLHFNVDTDKPLGSFISFKFCK